MLTIPSSSHSIQPTHATHTTSPKSLINDDIYQMVIFNLQNG